MKYLACLVLLLTLAGPVSASEVVTPTGEENYQELCAACHGATGKGDGPVAEVLATPPPDLTRITARNDGLFPRDELKRQIDGRDRIDAHGSQQMPVWGYEFWINAGAGATGGFSEREVSATLDALVDYLETIQVEPLGPRSGG